MSYVVLYESGIQQLLISPTGPVTRLVSDKADRIQQAADARIGHIPAERSGDLRASLKKVPIPSAEGARFAVGADSHHTHGRNGYPFPYARALETGINPLTGGPMHFTRDFAYMVPAVRDAGFRQR